MEPQRSYPSHLTRLQDREGKALTNFSRTLPAEDSDLTQQILKDPYSFKFLTLSSSAKERELERGLLKHLRDLLLELGRGFAFVGSQVQLEVHGQAYYIDLLFYPLRLPVWVKHGINARMTCSGIGNGRLQRSVSKSEKVNRETLSD